MQYYKGVSVLGDKHGFNKEDIKKGIILAGSLCVVIVFYYLLGKIGLFFMAIGKLISSMSSILVGCVIAFLLNPVMNLLHKAFISCCQRYLEK